MIMNSALSESASAEDIVLPPPLSLVQFRTQGGGTRAGAILDGGADVHPVDGDAGVYGIAVEAAERDIPLASLVESRMSGEAVTYAALESEGRLLAPVSHPDPAHCLLSGTGLTHRVSADGRHAMHAAMASGKSTDSLRLYRIGESGGNPEPGTIGALPEWFYKGDGDMLVAPGADLPWPAYARDAGDEVEIAGIYVVAADGHPARIGFALANEFSDHALERENYLYLAHSKLRCCVVGPEIRLDPLPDDVHGTARILRGGEPVWESGFASGNANMCHSIANLEHHHFRYRQFRRPGDVHVHFLGAATGSFTAGFATRAGDVIEIEADPFSKPLRNRLVREQDEGLVEVRPL